MSFNVQSASGYNRSKCRVSNPVPHPISNALPTYVLDGGFIFAGGVSWLLEKIGVRDETRNARLTDSIAGSMSTLTLFLFLMVILAMLI